MARKHSKTSTSGEEFEPIDPSDLGLEPEAGDLAGDAGEADAADTGGEPAEK